eukprot:8587025-Alexandrium_andersonii.AAC.1
MRLLALAHAQTIQQTKARHVHHGRLVAVREAVDCEALIEGLLEGHLEPVQGHKQVLLGLRGPASGPPRRQSSASVSGERGLSREGGQ